MSGKPQKSIAGKAKKPQSKSGTKILSVTKITPYSGKVIRKCCPNGSCPKR